MPRWSSSELHVWQQSQDTKHGVGDYSPAAVEKRAKKAAAMAEKELHRQIMSWLRLQGVKGIVHSRCDRPTTQAVGVPDLLLCFRGKPYAFEVKVGSNQPTTEQLQWLQDLREDGWTAAVVRSLDDVIALCYESQTPSP